MKMAVVLLVLSLISLVSCQENITFSVEEGQEKPVTVGNVARASNLRQQVGEDEFKALSYSIVPQDNSVDSAFKVEETTGNISTTGLVDRETFCADVSVCLLSLEIAVQSTRSAFFRKIPVFIHVKDINDNSPSFEMSHFRYDISESEKAGFSFSLPLASDKDSDVNNKVKYYQIVPSSLTFSLVSNEENGRVTSLTLSMLSDIDRESQDEHAFTLVAYDGANPPRSGTLSIVINVLDENDNPPTFQSSNYEATLQENNLIHSSVVQVKASDNDMGDNANISYFLSDQVPEIVTQLFTLDETTGLVTVRSSLNGEGGALFDFKVKAVDHGSSPLSSETRILVTVEDNVNDAPVIEVKLLFAVDGTATVPESSTIGRTAALVTVKDSDSGRNGLVACQISDVYFQLQKSDDTEYRVIVARALDRETSAIHNVSVSCQDQGVPPRSSSKSFFIQVTDGNDNAPAFLQEKYFFSIDENSAFPVVLGDLQAEDFDAGLNGDISYVISQNVSGSFSVNEITGEITAIKTFDRESVPKYTFLVYAVDKGETPLTGIATVVVNIGDKNDQSPKFIDVAYAFSVKENLPVGTFVGKVKAEDSDLGEGGKVQYTLRGPAVNGIVPFTVNEKGEIHTTVMLDHEKMKSYNFDVLASDLVTPPKITSVPVSVQIVDVNDNQPEISYPVPSNDSISIPHDMEPGTEIAVVQAYDLDTGLNGWLSFTIVGANQTGLFQISGSRGVITLGRAITANDIKKYDINISVYDSGIPQWTSYATLNVEVVYSKVFTGATSDANMKIVIALVCVTAFLAILVLGTLFTIRYMDSKRKYNHRDSEKAKYGKPDIKVKQEITELKPGVVLVTEGNKLTKKSVTFKNELTDMRDNMFPSEELKYNQLKEANNPQKQRREYLPPQNTHTPRTKSPSTSSEEVSVVDILHQHKAIVQSLRLNNKHIIKKPGEPEPDVWSDTSGETIGTDSGHGGSDLDMNSSLKMSV